MRRKDFAGLGEMMLGRHNVARELIDGEPFEAVSRISGRLNLTNQEVAELLVVTAADYVDQTLDVNGWRDHHMVEPHETPIFPGTGRPELSLFWIASALRAVPAAAPNSSKDDPSPRTLRVAVAASPPRPVSLDTHVSDDPSPRTLRVVVAAAAPRSPRTTHRYGPS